MFKQDRYWTRQASMHGSVSLLQAPFLLFDMLGVPVLWVCSFDSTIVKRASRCPSEELERSTFEERKVFVLGCRTPHHFRHSKQLPGQRCWHIRLKLDMTVKPEKGQQVIRLKQPVVPGTMSHTHNAPEWGNLDDLLVRQDASM